MSVSVSGGVVLVSAGLDVLLPDATRSAVAAADGREFVAEVRSGVTAFRRTDAVVLHPESVAGSHSDFLNAAFAAEAGKRQVKVRRGSAWTIDKPLILRSNLELVLPGDVTLESTMPFVDGHTNCLFFSAEVQEPSVVNGVTLTDAAVNIGDKSVVVKDASLISANPDNPSIIELIGGFGLSFVVTSKTAAPTGPLPNRAIIGLDRRVLKTVAVGATVRLYVPCSNVKIHGEGARMLGTGDRGAQLVATWNWEVTGLRIEMGNPAGTELQAAWAADWGGRNNRFRHLDIDGLQCTQCGWLIEGQIGTTIADCTVKGATNQAGYVNACQECTVNDHEFADCNKQTSTSGLLISAAAGDTTGSVHIHVRNVQCSDVGRPLVIGCGSSRVRVSGLMSQRASLHPIYLERGDSDTPPHHIVVNGATLRNGLSGVASICNGASNITLRDLDTENNAVNPTNLFFDVTATSNLLIDGWNFQETSVNALAAVGITNASSLTLRNLHGTFGGSPTQMTVFISAGGTGTTKVSLSDYDIATVAAAPTRVLLYTIGSIVNFRLRNGANPGWSYFTIVGANTTYSLGDNVVPTGGQTFTAGTRTVVNTTVS